MPFLKHIKAIINSFQGLTRDFKGFGKIIEEQAKYFISFYSILLDISNILNQKSHFVVSWLHCFHFKYFNNHIFNINRVTLISIDFDYNNLSNHLFKQLCHFKAWCSHYQNFN